MYATHAVAIQRWASKSPDNLARVIQLAIVSAHAPFSRIVSDMADAVEGGEEAKRAVLFGWKHKAFHDIWDAREAIAWNIADIVDLAPWKRANPHHQTDDYALAYLGGFHGLGFAKAGFALQMTLGLSGCLDVHNLRKSGHSVNVTRSHKDAVKKRETMLRRASAYNAICYSMGGPAGLWDAWCADMASRDPRRWRDAYHVSSLHCEALGV